MREGIEEQFDAFSDWILWALAGLLVLSMGIVLGIVIEKLSQKFIIPNNNKSTQQQTKGFASTINNTTAMNSSTSIQTIPYDPAKVRFSLLLLQSSNDSSIYFSLSLLFTVSQTYCSNYGWK